MSSVIIACYYKKKDILSIIQFQDQSNEKCNIYTCN